MAKTNAPKPRKAAKKAPVASKAAAKPAAKSAPKAAAVPAPKPSPRARKVVAKKSARTNPNQRELFEIFEMEAPKIEITLRVPNGTPITIGTPNHAAQSAAQPTAPSPAKALKQLCSMDKESLRKALGESGISVSELINLTTILHGGIYKLAAIGGKVTSRPRKDA